MYIYGRGVESIYLPPAASREDVLLLPTLPYLHLQTPTSSYYHVSMRFLKRPRSPATRSRVLTRAILLERATTQPGASYEVP
jgi:hypothetical protein